MSQSAVGATTPFQERPSNSAAGFGNPNFNTQGPPAYDDEVVDIAEYIGVLLDYKFFIGVITAFGLLLGITYALLATPIYKANALVQVEAQQSSGLAALEEVASLFEGETEAATEIQLLKSRMIIGRAVSDLSMTITAEPVYFPIIGAAVARQFGQSVAAKAGVAKPWFNLEQYAWGGEKLKVEFLKVPDSLLGRALFLVAGEGGQFEIEDGNSQVLFSGRVGELSEHTYDGEQGQEIQLFVATLKARAGTRFRVMKKSNSASINEVLSSFSAKEEGKKTGMIRLSYTHPDKTMIPTVLNKISDIYVEENIARNSAEAESSLSFLDKQLPPLKQRVDASEDAYNLYRMQHGSVDLAAETQTVLTEISKIDAALLTLEQQRDELRKKFKSVHPVIKALDGKIEILQKKAQSLESSTDKLPRTQRDILRLARDVELNTVLYTKLLNISQELRVVKAGTVGNVRVIDYALTPETPKKPQKKLIIAVATLASLMAGIVFAFMARAIRGGISDPDEIERRLNLPVYASVVHSKAQDKLLKKAKKTGDGIGILAHRHPEDLSVESLRSLRTSLHFTFKSAENNLILVTGASPKIGKSFTTMNLGAVLAQGGKRVLIIDADLRRGYLHRYIGDVRTNGISDLITDETIEPDACIRETEIFGLYLLPTGDLPSNPSELLLHHQFTERLNQLSSLFDYVLIDAPPILAVTDAAIVGKHCSTTLMVIKSDYHSARELEQATKQLLQAGLSVKGCVLNEVKVAAGRYGYGKYVYQYSYKA